MQYPTAAVDEEQVAGMKQVKVKRWRKVQQIKQLLHSDGTQDSSAHTVWLSYVWNVHLHPKRISN